MQKIESIFDDFDEIFTPLQRAKLLTCTDKQRKNREEFHLSKKRKNPYSGINISRQEEDAGQIEPATRKIH